MSKKAKLLSIGEASKYSGASIRSLRYYEQMKILTPAYTDPNSGYRYYSVDQLHHVWIIMACIELGIPLKELTKLSNSNDIINTRNIVEQGKALAESKLKSLKNSMKLFEIIEHQMNLSETYPKGQIYTRKIEEKIFYVHQCDKSNLNFLDVVKTYAEMPYVDTAFEGLTEYGVMHEYSPTGVEHFVFVEVQSRMSVGKNKTVPAGDYFCCLNENEQIGSVSEIFKEQLLGKTSFIAIETEILTDKYEMGKPFFSELRVIAL